MATRCVASIASSVISGAEAVCLVIQRQLNDQDPAGIGTCCISGSCCLVNFGEKSAQRRDRPRDQQFETSWKLPMGRGVGEDDLAD